MEVGEECNADPDVHAELARGQGSVCEVGRGGVCSSGSRGCGGKEGRGQFRVPIPPVVGLVIEINLLPWRLYKYRVNAVRLRYRESSPISLN